MSISGDFAKMKLLDIADMPNFSPSVSNGIRSVTDNKVFFGRHDWQSANAVDSPQCRIHGALLCVAKTQQGKIWRCEVCNEGCYSERSDI